ncbi:MAG: prepilin-type N-terminal cleavage/methylation domain-containing protein [Deltaproteobacteria bacterium]|nr:prepilin-type N-terminal cleavage/methylation domain-containing protein [Deltaproteobacteria bacterium]
MRRRLDERGFSLIELMVVVAILSVLASVAIPAFTRYLRRARTVEVIEALASISTGAKAYFQVHGNFPDKSKGYAPKMSIVRACKRYSGIFPRKEMKRDFAGEPWTSLLFTPGDNTRYRYRFIVRQPKQLKKRRRPGYAYIWAQGDLDCNRQYAEWRLSLFELSDSPGTLRQAGPYLVRGIDTD